MMVRKDCSARANHVKGPCAAGPPVNALHAAGKAVRTPPLWQRLFVHPGFPDDVSRHLHRSLQHHGSPGPAGQIVKTGTETLLIAIAHILRQRGKPLRCGQAATLFNSLKCVSAWDLTPTWRERLPPATPKKRQIDQRVNLSQPGSIFPRGVQETIDVAAPVIPGIGVENRRLKTAKG